MNTIVTLSMRALSKPNHVEETETISSRIEGNS